VSAPTGAGKTWIAAQAISRYLSRGLKTWYASPLKALSNSIYRAFCMEFGPEQCGILTGDRKENPGAPIIIGTTEILRNQLYDAMHQGTSIQADLVILDEAHYLSDPDRGVVWEEVLIYLSSRVRLLLLSATISNAEEIASWLKENRGSRTSVVRSDERPVPLEMLFLFPDGLISPLAGRKGLVPRVKKFAENQAGQKRGSGRLNFGEIIKSLRAFDLLPAIFFLKSRTDCDHALFSCASAERPYDVMERFRREVRAFVRKYPHLETHRQLRPLTDYLVGSHHAGQLPYWKLLIEEMMNKGYLEAIFSTSTVAAGVNFPARSVVLVQSDRFNGHEFSNLTATELHQMTGRAGRRGKDNIGFALILPGPHQDPELIHRLKDSPPEPLESQIHINFSMTLNLLLSHAPLEVKDLLNRSFASFQERKRGPVFQQQWEKVLEALKSVLPGARCDVSDPYEVIENIQTIAELRRETIRVAGETKNRRLLEAYREHLQPGRLIRHKNSNLYVVFDTFMHRGRLVCNAHCLKRMIRIRKGRISLKKVDIAQIRAVLDYMVDLPQGYSIEVLEPLFSSIPLDDLRVLNVDVSGKGAAAGEPVGVKERPPVLPCEKCDHLKTCLGGKKSEIRGLLQRFEAMSVEIAALAGGLWLSFKRHLRFLKNTGFVDAEDHLTPDGMWASKLRLDHPLLIAEAIRKGAFSDVSPEVMAGCIAPFVWDRVQEVEMRISSGMNLLELGSAFNSMVKSIENIRALMLKRGFENPQIFFWPAAALFLWARGTPWEELLSFFTADEGDIASLIIRTADHLRQVAGLEETHPDLASAATKAVTLILREPVFLD